MLASSLVFKKDGKKIKGLPVSGTHNVYPVKGSAISIISGADIVKALKVQFPACTFNYFNRPAEADAEATKEEGEKK